MFSLAAGIFNYYLSHQLREESRIFFFLCFSFQVCVLSQALGMLIGSCFDYEVGRTLMQRFHVFRQFLLSINLPNLYLITKSHVPLNNLVRREFFDNSVWTGLDRLKGCSPNRTAPREKGIIQTLKDFHFFVTFIVSQ